MRLLSVRSEGNAYKRKQCPVNKDITTTYRYPMEFHRKMLPLYVWNWEETKQNNKILRADFIANLHLTTPW
jgi:hypothetical protein